MDGSGMQSRGSIEYRGLAAAAGPDGGSTATEVSCRPMAIRAKHMPLSLAVVKATAAACQASGS